MRPDSTSLFIPIRDTSQASTARREIEILAKKLKFDETERGKLSIIANELATNLLKHTKTGGEIVVRVLSDGSNQGLEILSVDSGPGIQDTNKALQDGFSTAGSPGTGLGAIKRLSTRFDIFSKPEKGTVVVSRFYKEPPKDNSPKVGAVNEPYPGESASGDGYAYYQDEKSFTCFVADGLGHGIQAHEASGEAVRIFHEGVRKNTPIANIMQDVHSGLLKTRGAAAAIARVDLAENKVHFIGIGNIGASVLSTEKNQFMVSSNGTLGAEVRKLQEFTYPWEKDYVLVMASDGLKARWSLQDYPGLIQRDPALIAGVFFRDFRRDNDDSTIVVVKNL